MVFANKQDLPGGERKAAPHALHVMAGSLRFHLGLKDHILTVAMSPAEVTEKLGLHKMRERSWYVHPRRVPSSVLGCRS